MAGAWLLFGVDVPVEVGLELLGDAVGLELLGEALGDALGLDVGFDELEQPTKIVVAAATAATVNAALVKTLDIATLQQLKRHCPSKM